MVVPVNVGNDPIDGFFGGSGRVGFVNNGIILIDYTNILRKRGNRIQRALMNAGVSRIRPILITAATTIVAMVPLAMGQAEYVSAIGAAFAITVIGGLTLTCLS